MTVLMMAEFPIHCQFQDGDGGFQDARKEHSFSPSFFMSVVEGKSRESRAGLRFGRWAVPDRRMSNLCRHPHKNALDLTARYGFD